MLLDAVGKCSRTPKDAEYRVNNTRTEQFKRLKPKDECKYKPKKNVKLVFASEISRVFYGGTARRGGSDVKEVRLE